MPDQPSTGIMQVNLATNQRNAARDYYEHFSANSVKLVLATWPKARLDALALENATMFQHRFGFEAREEIRRQVLEIKNQYDYSDRNIRWLRYSGQLVIIANEAKLKPSRLMPLIGWTQLTLFGLICIAMLLQITFSTAPAWKQAVCEIAVAAFSFGVFWILNELYIAPWRILKRSGALSSIANPG